MDLHYTGSTPSPGSLQTYLWLYRHSTGSTDIPLRLHVVQTFPCFTDISLDLETFSGSVDVPLD